MKNAIIYQEFPVLLCQGFDPVQTFAGSPQKRTYEVATDRGRVKEVDVMYLEHDPALLPFLDASITLQAGGVNLITDSSLNEFFYNLQLGAMKNHNIKTDLAPAQTLFSVIKANGVFPARSQVQLFYSTPQYEEFSKNFRWRHSLGPKRQTFKLDIAATGVPETYSSVKITIPKQNGPIIGISCICLVELLDRVPDLYFDIKINGVTVFENVSLFNTYPTTGRDKYIYPLPVQPGSIMEIVVRDLTGNFLGSNDKFFTTIYFDN